MTGKGDVIALHDEESVISHRMKVSGILSHRDRGT